MPMIFSTKILYHKTPAQPPDHAGSRYAGARDHRSLGGSADELRVVGSCHGCHAEGWHLGTPWSPLITWVF